MSVGAAGSPDEILIGKLIPVDGFSPGPVSPREIASLGHETRDDAVENRVLRRNKKIRTNDE